MIDFHCHILPALDDGAVTIDDSIAMAKALADFGYTTVCCTPHCIRGYYDITPKKVREATLMLQADLDNADINLELWPGMEYMLDECFAEVADDLQPLGDTRLILCEAPPLAHPGVVLESLELIIAKGYVPLIAHPERTHYFNTMFTKPEDLEENRKERSEHREVAKAKSFLRRLFAPRPSRFAPHRDNSPTVKEEGLPRGILFQANLGSFSGFYGETIQRRAYELLKLGVYAALASDLHDSSSAEKALIHDKIENNPLLKKLSEFDGVATEVNFDILLKKTLLVKLISTMQV
jgi:protein-tyrosine phosphatase